MINMIKYFRSISATILMLSFGAQAFAQASELAAVESSKPVCVCEKTTWQQAFLDSDFVMFGEVKKVINHADDLATGEFLPIEVFKGSDDYIKKVVGASKADISCRQVLRPGFFIVYSKQSQSVVLNKCVPSRQLRPEEDLVKTLADLNEFANKHKVASQLDNTGEATARGESQEKTEVSWLQQFVDWIIALFAGWF